MHSSPTLYTELLSLTHSHNGTWSPALLPTLFGFAAITAHDGDPGFLVRHCPYASFARSPERIHHVVVCWWVWFFGACHIPPTCSYCEKVIKKKARKPPNVDGPLGKNEYVSIPTQRTVCLHAHRAGLRDIRLLPLHSRTWPLPRQCLCDRLQ